MRYLAVIFCVLLSFPALAGVTADTASKTTPEVTQPKLYPEGAFFSGGLLINNYFGFSLKTGVMMGPGRVKLGFIMGYNSMGFEDTLKTNSASNNTSSNYSTSPTVINSLALGFTSKVYNQAGSAYFSATGCFLLPTYDSRFASTNGLGLSMALGILPNPEANSTLYFEMGFKGMAFSTKTDERPNAFGVMLNIGVNL